MAGLLIYHKKYPWLFFFVFLSLVKLKRPSHCLYYYATGTKYSACCIRFDHTEPVGHIISSFLAFRGAALIFWNDYAPTSTSPRSPQQIPTALKDERVKSSQKLCLATQKHSPRFCNQSVCCIKRTRNLEIVVSAILSVVRVNYGCKSV